MQDMTKERAKLEYIKLVRRAHIFSLTPNFYLENLESLSSLNFLCWTGGYAFSHGLERLQVISLDPDRSEHIQRGIDSLLQTGYAFRDLLISSGRPHGRIHCSHSLCRWKVCAFHCNRRRTTGTQTHIYAPHPCLTRILHVCVCARGLLLCLCFGACVSGVLLVCVYAPVCLLYVSFYIYIYIRDVFRACLRAGVRAFTAP